MCSLVRRPRASRLNGSRLFKSELVSRRSAYLETAFVVLTLIGITSSILGHMKSVKMTGLTGKLKETIHKLRLEEMDAALPSRLMATISSTIAQFPLLLSPAAAFSIFVAVARTEGTTLDAGRMFSSLSLIVLLTQPLFFLFEVILDINTALGCFGRIEKFLEAQTRNDTRRFEGAGRRESPLTRPVVSPADDRIEAAHAGSEIELIELDKSAASHNGTGSGNGNGSDLSVEKLTLTWPDGARPVVKDVSFSLPRGRFAMVVGPVASGKTTLLKGLLGEVPNAEGIVSIGRTRMAWCDQTPWLIVCDLSWHPILPLQAMINMGNRTIQSKRTSSASPLPTSSCTPRSS